MLATEVAVDLLPKVDSVLRVDVFLVGDVLNVALVEVCAVQVQDLVVVEAGRVTMGVVGDGLAIVPIYVVLVLVRMPMSVRATRVETVDDLVAAVVLAKVENVAVAVREVIVSILL